MMRTLFAVALLLGIANPALAQNTPPPSPYAPLQDKPSCTREQLKAATAAYVEAQRSGKIGGLPLASNAHYLENMETVERSARLWNSALPIANAMSFHDHTRCKTFTEIIRDRRRPFLRHRHAALHA
jgi:hypothetical protein